MATVTILPTSGLPVTQPESLEQVLACAYPFVVTAEPEGSFSIHFPDLPGCMSLAHSWDDIGPMAREASELWLTGEWEANHPIPKPTLCWNPIEPNITQPVSRIDGLPEPGPQPIYTAADVADILSISRSRVHQLARERDLGQSIAGARLFTSADVVAMQQRPAVGRPAHSTQHKRH